MKSDGEKTAFIVRGVELNHTIPHIKERRIGNVFIRSNNLHDTDLVYNKQTPAVIRRDRYHHWRGKSFSHFFKTDNRLRRNKRGEGRTVPEGCSLWGFLVCQVDRVSRRWYSLGKW